jgi:hypothetical protein
MTITIKTIDRGSPGIQISCNPEFLIINFEIIKPLVMNCTNAVSVRGS